MCRYSISYPQNNMNIIVEKCFAYIFLKFTNKGESYVIFHHYHRMKPNLLISKVRDKKIFLYSTLSLVLDEF